MGIEDTPQVHAATRRRLEEHCGRLAEQYGQSRVNKAEAEAALAPKLRELQANAEQREEHRRAEHARTLAELEGKLAVDLAQFAAQNESTQATVRAAVERVVTTAETEMTELSAAHDAAQAELDALRAVATAD